MVIRLGRNGRFLACSLYPGAQGIAAAARRGGRRPRPGEGEVCPQCGEGTLVGKRGKFGPFVGCSRYPDCNYIKKEGPPPPDPLAVRGRLPEERRRHARRASRAADRQRLLGVLELPEVRLHDELRAGRGAPRRRRRARREEGRVRDLPEVRRRRAAARATTTLVGARLAGGPPNPEALARPARGGGRGAARRRPERTRRPSAAERGDAEPASRTTRRTRQTERRARTREPGRRRPSPHWRGSCAVLAARDASPHTRARTRRPSGRTSTGSTTAASTGGRPSRTDLRAYLAELGLARRPQLDRPAARGDPLVPPLRGPGRASPTATRGARSRRRACRAACRASSRSTRSSGCWRSSTRSWPRPAARASGRRSRPRSRSATGRSSRPPTPPGSGSASWPRRTSGRWTSGAARSGSSARAARSGSGCWAGRPVRRSTRYLEDGRPVLVEVGSAGTMPGTTDDAPTEVFLNHRGAAARRPRPPLPARPAPPPGGPAGRRLAPHAPPLVRDPPARRRRGPAGRPGAARPREPRDDAGLHARLADPPAGRLPRRPSARDATGRGRCPDGDAAS